MDYPHPRVFTQYHTSDKKKKQSHFIVYTISIFFFFLFTSFPRRELAKQKKNQVENRKTFLEILSKYYVFLSITRANLVFSSY